MLSLTNPEHQEPKKGEDLGAAETETFVSPEELKNEDPVSQDNPQQEPEIPEKYRGKSLVDIVRMHQEAEKQIGRQGQELGSARKDREYYQAMLDQLIEQRSGSAAQPQPEQEEEVDFFSDPDRAVESRVKKMLESNPDLQEARLLKQEVTKQSALSQLQKEHPDWQSIAQDPEFAEWVKSSQFRTQLALQADKYDYAAANELFSLYKERSGYQQRASEEAQVARKSNVQKASTGAPKATGESRGKRSYRQSDIINLIRNDPTRYRALESEIQAAFREGRVVMDRG